MDDQNEKKSDGSASPIAPEITKPNLRAEASAVLKFDLIVVSTLTLFCTCSPQSPYATKAVSRLSELSGAFDPAA